MLALGCTLGADAATPPRQADADRRILPAPGGPRFPHAHRRADDRRGSAAGDGGISRTDPRAPAPRSALPPQARLHSARLRAPGVGGRPELQPRVPRPPHGAADARHLGPAAEPGRPHLLPTARPLKAAMGDVADRGSEGRPLRADHEDPSLADRRHRRGGPGDGAVRPLARTAADQALRARLAAAPRAGHRGAGRSGSARSGARRGGAGRGSGRRDHPSRPRARPRARRRRGDRRDHLGRPQPRPGDAAERAHRPPPALSRHRRLAGGLQDRQERLRRHRQRRRCSPSSPAPCAPS